MDPSDSAHAIEDADLEIALMLIELKFYSQHQRDFFEKWRALKNGRERVAIEQQIQVLFASFQATVCKIQDQRRKLAGARTALIESTVVLN